jgi:hypothetical protein
MKALEKDPNARFPSVQAFAQALLPFAPKEPIPSGMRLRIPTSARRRRMEIMAGANCNPNDPTVLRGEPRGPTEGSWSSAHPALAATLAATKRRKRWALAMVAMIGVLFVCSLTLLVRARRASTAADHAAAGAPSPEARIGGSGGGVPSPPPTVDVETLPRAGAASSLAQPEASASAAVPGRPAAAPTGVAKGATPPKMAPPPPAAARKSPPAPPTAPGAAPLHL